MQPRELGIRWRRAKALTLSVDTRLELPPAVPQCGFNPVCRGSQAVVPAWQILVRFILDSRR
jgi:hypothetical protein